MRIVELSDHPGAMLRETRQRRAAEAERQQRRHEEALARHRERVGRAILARDDARARHRWLAWLRAVFAVRRERQGFPVAPRPQRLSSDREEALAAGVAGEQLVVAGLSRVLGDDWTLIRGYCNRRGEIDHLVLGPRGLFAIEGKHHSATVHCDGDRWWYVKQDKYGNAVGRGEMTDRRGRSPSEQLNEPANQLEDFLRSRGHAVAIQRVVAFTHARSRVGTCTRPTVRVATSVDQIISLLNGSAAVIADSERTQLERLIRRDHRYHQRGRAHP